jgi:hypothetical protein
MPSESKQARETQKKTIERAIQSRRNLLAEGGVEQDRILKDPHLKHLQAKMRKTLRRLGTVEAMEKKQEEMALRKQQKLEASKAEPDQRPEEPPKEGKKKQKKAKKKEQKAEE